MNKTDQAIHQLMDYAIEKKLIQPEDRIWAINQILQVLQKDGIEPCKETEQKAELHEILEVLIEDGAKRGLIDQDSITQADLFDTRIMGALVARPSQISQTFWNLYAAKPEKATNWFYTLSQDSNYIRKDRIQKDKHWTIDSQYGPIEISINLSKPEKDPKAIAAAAHIQSDYPRCALCIENEGYGGSPAKPARQNHRIIPLRLDGEDWYFQYSPYVYYNEHCIVLNGTHQPMKIDRSTFVKLFDFVDLFDHYFIGSNADLPIVGGSILAHEHFQGGKHLFAMQKAPVKIPYIFDGYEDIQAGIVKWPLSVLRLQSSNRQKLTELAQKILDSWRNYEDPNHDIIPYTGDISHNTITPIARKENGIYLLDLVLRNNRTSEQFPDGIFHPHPFIHPIKKENIGLIEVMGLAILPARLDQELSLLAKTLQQGQDPAGTESISRHASWVKALLNDVDFTKLSIPETEKILRQKTGEIFLEGLSHCGVFKDTSRGEAAFVKFLNALSSD